jgi:hypothetical protein
VLSVVDTYTRECLALEVDTGFASRRVTRELDEIIARRGRPLSIRCDNGPELTSRPFLAWALEWKIDLRHIQPGKPIQNAHVERFHGGLREECLRVSWFRNLFDARIKIAGWRKEYIKRPHRSLVYRTPAGFAQATQSCGKDADFVCLETPPAFPTLRQLLLRDKFVGSPRGFWGQVTPPWMEQTSEAFHFHPHARGFPPERETAGSTRVISPVGSHSRALHSPTTDPHLDLRLLWTPRRTNANTVSTRHTNSTPIPRFTTASWPVYVRMNFRPILDRETTLSRNSDK